VKTTDRLFFLDNLRVFLITLVIAHHVGQAYGPTGGWWPIQEAARTALLGPFFVVNRSFMMSLFFLIAGYFTVIACDVKGPIVFLKGRLLRLGIPVVIYGLIMIPLQIFVFAPPGTKGSAWPIDVGHLWFLQHLLIFSAGYVLWRLFRGNRTNSNLNPINPPGNLPILLYALALALITGVVRIWYPIDRWSHVLGFIRVMYADIPRDLGFFIIGLMAGRHKWILKFPTRFGRSWLLIGVIATILMYVYILGLEKILLINPMAKNIAYLIWEQLLCFGLSIGLIILFREKLNFTNRLEKVLAKSQYSAYIFHIPLVILFHALALKLQIPPFAKFVLVTLVSVPITFLFSSLVRKPLHL
jgi:glucan biosynthesis protein C